MSGPRNNLDDVLKKRQLTSTPSAVPASSTSQSQGGPSKSKFRAATKPLASALPATTKASVQKTPSHSSFSTPGFGRKKPMPLTATSSSPITISSAETTPSSGQQKRVSATATVSTPVAQVITSLPSKRNSPSAFHAAEPPSKRSRPSAELHPSDKENLFDTTEDPRREYSDTDDAPAIRSKDKGKSREVPRNFAPPASQRNIDFSSATPSRHTSHTVTRPAAPQSSSRPSPFVLNLRTAVQVTDSSSASSQATSITRESCAPEDPDSSVRRSVTLDYSRLFDMSVEDLLNVKAKMLDMRSKMLDHCFSLDNDAGNDEVRMMLREYDDMTQDKLSCIDALVSARRAGRAPQLPASKWATTSRMPSEPLIVPPSIPPSYTQAIDPDPVDDPPPPPRVERHFEPFEPYDGPDLLEEEPDMDESTDVDAYGGGNYGARPRSPIVVESGPDSDDMLWDQVHEAEVEVVERTPVQPVASSSTAVPAAVISSSTNASAIVPLDPELTKRPYYKDIIDIRNKVFKITSWRPKQLEAICSIMDGNDTFVLMPTGGGKSLTFQLPAEVMHRTKRMITLIVGPLIALMNDQEQAMKKKGMKVVMFYGNKDGEEEDVGRENQLYDLVFDRKNGPAVVYATPEKIHKNGKFRQCLLRLHKEKRLFMIAVDEAHVIASWGRTFRESLTELHWLRENLPGIPIMALTATANAQAKAHIKDQLCIQGCTEFCMSFNRPNLNYEIRPKAGRHNDILKDIVEYIKSKHSGECGIVYVGGRDKVEETACTLDEVYGISTQAYHAGLTKPMKEKIQRDWQSGKVKVIVATIAFGMGIDKEDVRFVVHYQLPDSLSGYYQETGRAGRDGKPSDCVLYYAYKDAAYVLQCARKADYDSATTEYIVDNARRVVQYCLNNTDCRRTQVLAYFEEKFSAEKCNGRCDNCRNTTPVTREDVTDNAHRYIQLAQHIRKTRENASRNMLVDCFLGKSTAVTKKKGFDNCPAFGIARGTDRGRAERLFDQLMTMGIFEPIQVQAKFSKYSNEYVQLTVNGDAFLRSKKRLEMLFREPPPKMRKTNSKKGGVSAQGAKRTRRKVAEIAEDPIEDDIDEDADYPPHVNNFPDDVDGTVPVARPATRSAAPVGRPARTYTEVEDDDDDDVVILDPPQSASQPPRRRPLSRDMVMEQCYRELLQLRDEDIENDEVMTDEALQYVSAMMPEDVEELVVRLGELDVDIDFVEPFLHSIIDVVLKHRGNLPPPEGTRSKPPPSSSSSKKNIGARPKPPSIIELHSHYEFRQGGSSSSSKPPSRKRN